MNRPVFVGQSVQRLEDPDLLTGRGQFVDDIKLPGLLQAAFVRSPFAHARIGDIDVSAALQVPGVVAVFTAEDLPRGWRGRRILLQVPNPAIPNPITQQPLADREVCFVGEAVAVVVAETRHAAEDGVERVQVDYDPQPVAGDCQAAIVPGAPTAHLAMQDNIAARFNIGFGDISAAFDEAPHRLDNIFRVHRGTGHPMECRGVAASYDPISQSYTIWSSTQTPHNTQRAVVDMFGVSEERIRVITPDVGGGFGPKNQVYPEEITVPWLAEKLGTPVKWIEDRREHFLTTTQERDQIYDCSVAYDDRGKILGLKTRILHDAGAYLPWGTIMPYISASTLPGPYKLPAYRADVTVAFTNMVPTTPMRGAGRPQAVFVMERTVDLIAAQLGLDPADVRSVNLIPVEDMPYHMGLTYRDGQPVIYDSGNYPECQRLALERAGYKDFKERQQRARADNRYIGIGIGAYVEGTGLGPFEGAIIRILSNGRVSLKTGATPAGQAHHTTLAQICADELGVDITDIDIVLGDTGAIPRGAGTYASRVTVNAGSSVRIASGAVATKLKALAAAHFDVGADEFELADGNVFVRSRQGVEIAFAELAKMTSGMPGYVLPNGVQPDLEAHSYFTPPRATYSNGCHVAEVEVDPDTGLVKILNYVVVHDCGKVINPMLVDGQIIGGVVHGIGNALLERMVFDADSNPITTTFADYLMPTAELVPKLQIIHMESQTPLNPLGAKGAGEGGTIPAAAAIVAAVEHALEPFDIKILESPILPQRICELIDAASAGQTGK